MSGLQKVARAGGGGRTFRLVHSAMSCVLFLFANHKTRCCYAHFTDEGIEAQKGHESRVLQLVEDSDLELYFKAFGPPAPML